MQETIIPLCSLFNFLRIIFAILCMRAGNLRFTVLVLDKCNGDFRIFRIVLVYFRIVIVPNGLLFHLLMNLYRLGHPIPFIFPNVLLQLFQ